MLSFGTDDFLAFWMASYSVGLPVGSPPPIRAATSMFLISFANILPRRASMTAFLCLVVAHFEWPDMRPLLTSSVCGQGTDRGDEVHEQLVDPGVATHLRVERRRHQRALPDRDDPTRGRSVLDPREHLDVVADPLDPRRPDEDRVHRLGEPGEVEVALERVDLPPERVAAHGDVEAAQRLLAGVRRPRSGRPA